MFAEHAPTAPTPACPLQAITEAEQTLLPIPNCPLHNTAAEQGAPAFPLHATPPEHTPIFPLHTTAPEHAPAFPLHTTPPEQAPALALQNTAREQAGIKLQTTTNEVAPLGSVRLVGLLLT